MTERINKSDQVPAWKKLTAIVAMGSTAFLAACGHETDSSDDTSSTITSVSSTYLSPVESSSSTPTQPEQDSSDPETYKFDPNGFITLRYEIDPNDQKAVNKFADELLGFYSKQMENCLNTDLYQDEDIVGDYVKNHIVSKNADISAMTEWCLTVNGVANPPMNGKMIYDLTRQGDASIELGKDGLPTSVNIPQVFLHNELDFLGLKEGTQGTLEKKHQVVEATYEINFYYDTTTDESNNRTIDAWLNAAKYIR